MINKTKLTFLITSLLTFLYSITAFAQSDSMNNFLEQRKKETLPFNTSDVKIDLESLGLDNVENNKQEFTSKPLGSENNNNNFEIKSNNQSNQVIDNKLIEDFQTKNIKQDSQKTPKKNGKTKSNKTSKTSTVVETQEDLNNKIKTINFQKKQKLSARLKQEAIKTKDYNKQPNSIEDNFTKTLIIDDFFTEQDQLNFNSKPYDKTNYQSINQSNKASQSSTISNLQLKDKKQVLNYLRRQYLGEESDSKIERLKMIDSDFNDEDLIIPKPKNLNRFLQDELPAYPILSPLRTQDNFHIPSVISPKQKIEILFQTISNGDIKSFVEIYKQIKNPNIQNEFGDTIITKAIILKRHDILAEILMKGADPDLPNRLGYTPLEIAIELLDFRAIEILVENRVNINSVDRFGRTYLMHASRVGLLPAVDLLVKNNASINATDNDGFSALSIAYRHKKEIIVQYLLKNGAQQWIERKNIPEQQKLILELQDRWK